MRKKVNRKPVITNKEDAYKYISEDILGNKGYKDDRVGVVYKMSKIWYLSLLKEFGDKKKVLQYLNMTLNLRYRISSIVLED